MSNSNNIISAGSAGIAVASIFGATALQASPQPPHTGLEAWVFYLVLVSVIACIAIFASYIVTRIVRWFIKK